RGHNTQLVPKSRPGTRRPAGLARGVAYRVPETVRRPGLASGLAFQGLLGGAAAAAGEDARVARLVLELPMGELLQSYLGLLAAQGAESVGRLGPGFALLRVRHRHQLRQRALVALARSVRVALRGGAVRPVRLLRLGHRVV